MDGWMEVDMTCMDGILGSASIGTIILVVAIKIAFLFFTWVRVYQYISNQMHTQL